MPALETAAIAVGTAVAKAACGVWLGKDAIMQAAGASTIDLAAGKLGSLRSRRQFHRLWQQAAEEVAERIEPIVNSEFAGLPENERLAAMDAVTDTFDIALLTDADIFAQDLDATFLDRTVRARDRDRVLRAGLSMDSAELYNLLLRESCAYLIEIVRTLPSAGMSAAVEMLRRDRQILDDIRTVLQRLPIRRGASDFQRDYLQLVVNRLDEVELFGVTLSEQSRRYPLSVAYLNLRVSGDFVLRRTADEPIAPGMSGIRPDVTVSNARVDQVLADTSRLFIRGQAGTGKTTLLHWIAVQCARRSFPEFMAPWNDTIPFFVSLRRYGESELPAPEQFLSEIGRHIADEKPPSWVHEQLRSGRGVLLVDGVDELPEQRRVEARRWLSDLVSTFPAARVVVTSRPAAATADWLGQDDFDVAELEPMTPPDVQTFVHRWHEALRNRSADPAEIDTLTEYETHLLGLLATRSHLRSVASYPLLCALLCALHQDRRGHLPGTRMEFYEVALHMLLERRDRERGTGTTLLSRTDSTLLLRDVAYWLVRNGLTAAPADRVRDRLATKLAVMTHVDASAETVYRVLLERSGLIREAVQGQTDFLHRMFQDYLAAAEAVAMDDIGALVANSQDDMWAEVIVMAAGHASAKQRVELLSGIIDRAETGHAALGLTLVAVACLETSPELPPMLLARIKESASILLPPKSMGAANLISRSGTFALDLLADCDPVKANEKAATIRAISEIGDPAGLPLLARFAMDSRKPVFKEVMRAWCRLDADDYARVVVSKMPLPGGHLNIDDPQLVWSLTHVPRLQSLYCGYEKSDCGFDFVRSLQHLERLGTQDTSVPTLGPLAGSNLVKLNMLSGTDEEALSLAPLATVSTLSDVAIWSRPVADARALAGLPNLKRVRLDYLMDRSAIRDLSSMTDLEELGIGHIEDLTDLRALDFLRAPTAIAINGCPVNDDIGHLSKWAKCLTSLSLRNFDDLDLRPLSDLVNLRYLDIQSSTVRNVASLAVLPNLYELATSYDPNLLPDVPAIRSLRVLWVTSPAGRAIDITPLAGVRELEVRTWRTVPVWGAAELGPGSRVRRS
jgi:hypothetical protein